jgi:H/ACA ribonucleoprotein complex non-core subunit NAF1
MIVHLHQIVHYFQKISSRNRFVFLFKLKSFSFSILINEDSDDDDEQQALRNRYGPRTRNELAIDELPPIENLTITLSDETPIERIGYIRHIIDGKLVIIESLLHSPPLNDDSVLFNRDRRSIGLIFETFGPVEQPYYSIRYNHINNIHQRQIELNQEVFYAPKETTYTKYVFVQELKALKGSDASWEDDNEPPKFAIEYSDDEQERAAKALHKEKRNMEESTDKQIMNSTNNESHR